MFETMKGKKRVSITLDIDLIDRLEKCANYNIVEVYEGEANGINIIDGKEIIGFIEIKMEEKWQI